MLKIKDVLCKRVRVHVNLLITHCRYVIDLNYHLIYQLDAPALIQSRTCL